MKFVIKKAQILTKIQFVNSIVPVRNPLQILTNILFDVDEETNRIKLAATDLEVTALAELEGDVEEGGKICVPAKEITDIIRSLPDEEVHFTTENNILKVECLHIDFKLIYSKPEDYPEIPERDWEKSFTIDATLFSKMIEKTSFAASTQVGRPAFTGVLWEFGEDGQRMVATDGKRLGKFDTNLSLEVETKKIVIPIKGLNLINRIIEEDKPELKVIPEESVISFKYNSYKIFSRLIEANYPDYNAVIPYDNSKEVKVELNPFLNAVKRVSLIASEDNSKVVVNFSKKQMIIQCEDVEKGTAKEVIEIDSDINDFKIGFNHKYLQEILHLIDSEKVTIKMENSLDPTLFFNTDEEDEKEKILLLLMPLRLATD